MNVYSDSFHSALKYLKDTEVNVNNLLIMTSIIIADSFNLDLSIPTNPTFTRYSDTEGKANSVIDLMFLHSRSTELNNYLIHPN